jgi:hypothetical protein
MKGAERGGYPISALAHTELGLQVREGSALEAIADRELPLEPAALTFVCAWCQDGAAPRPGDFIASHGICPACAERMRAEYRQATSRKSTL